MCLSWDLCIYESVPFLGTGCSFGLFVVYISFAIEPGRSRLHQTGHLVHLLTNDYLRSFSSIFGLEFG